MGSKKPREMLANRLCETGINGGSRQRRRDDVATLEHNCVIAQPNLVTRYQASWADDLLSVEERSVFRCRVVNLATAALVNHNRTMSSGDAAIGNDDIVIRHSANAVHTRSQGQNGIFVDQPKLDRGGDVVRAFNDCVRMWMGVFGKAFQVNRDGV